MKALTPLMGLFLILYLTLKDTAATRQYAIDNSSVCKSYYKDVEASGGVVKNYLNNLNSRKNGVAVQSYGSRKEYYPPPQQQQQPNQRTGEYISSYNESGYNPDFDYGYKQY